MTLTDSSTQRMTRTVEEAAALLGIGRTGVYKLTKTGELRSIKVGRKIIIPLSALDNFLSGNTSGAN